MIHEQAWLAAQNFDQADVAKKLAEGLEKSVRITDHYEIVVQEKESECFEYLVLFISLENNKNIYDIYRPHINLKTR